MRKITDITGLIDERMWRYGPPFPDIRIDPLPPVSWVRQPVACEIFTGLHSQTGTYLETPAHFYGNDDPRSYPLIDVPVEQLVDHPCVVLNTGLWPKSPPGSRLGVTVADLEACPNAGLIRPGDAILIGTGWGRYWQAPDYLETSPYLTRAAVDWLIAKQPYLLGSDTSRWENLQEPQGFFPDFYAAGILMLGACVRLEAVGPARCSLTVLPLKVPRTSCAPCRAIVCEDL